MAPAIRADPIEYIEQGSGPTLLFVPGSFATPSAWRGIQKRLPATYRMVATSLCGYGETVETRSPGDLGIEHEIAVVEAAAVRAGGPVILVGHSFGATVALATALKGRIPVRAVATFEANPLALIKEAGSPDLYEDARAMSTAFETAHRAGEPDAAGRVIDYWGGAGSFAAMPVAVREFCRAGAGSNVLDWHTAFGFHATAADYGGLSMPVLMVRGALANPAMVAITDVLARSIPGARSAVVAGASHFLITTHAETCAKLLADFLGELA